MLNTNAIAPITIGEKQFTELRAHGIKKILHTIVSVKSTPQMTEPDISGFLKTRTLLKSFSTQNLLLYLYFGLSFLLPLKKVVHMSTETS